MEKRCETCRYTLGGGYDNCRINLEAECAAGGFEAWEPKQEEYEPETGCDLETATRAFDQALASTGVLSKKIIGIALSRPVEELFGCDDERLEG